MTPCRHSLLAATPLAARSGGGGKGGRDIAAAKKAGHLKIMTLPHNYA